MGDVLRYPEHLGTAMLAAGLSGNVAGLDTIVSGLDMSPVRGRMVQVIRMATEACRAALDGRTNDAIAGFVRALEHRSLRLDRAQVQGLFAAVVGTDAAEARRASEEAFAAFSEVGAAAYLDLFAAGMPQTPGRLAAGG